MKSSLNVPSLPLPSLVRRDFLFGCGLGLGSVAMASLRHAEAAAHDGAAERVASPLAPKPPHFGPRAKAVIQLFMVGGPSQLELFDYKPRLQRLEGQIVPPSVTDGKRFLFIKPDARLLGTRRKFQRYGDCGAEVSELLPHTARIVDQLAIVKTMTTDNVSHGAAKLITQTGYSRFGYPSMGSWLLYALGSESRDLPGYVVLQSGPRGPRGGSYLWSNGFLSSLYQGVPFRAQGDPILNLSSPPNIDESRQRRVVETVAELNRLRAQATGDDELLARSANYEMAHRMQHSAPALMDISRETPETLRLYGIKPGEPSFGMNCLLARRMVERGVRFVTLFHSNWDHHGGAENLEGELDKVCREVDQASAALVLDLRRRGMLDETLVTWGGEFGRTPMGEVRATIGRDHHIEAYTLWLAGGGIRGGQTIGQTDELGFAPTDMGDRIHVHDLQATLLHLLGLDHLRVSHRHQGRDFRLTDVSGRVVERLCA
jgi:hypothetical protein